MIVAGASKKTLTFITLDHQVYLQRLCYAEGTGEEPQKRRKARREDTKEAKERCYIGVFLGLFPASHCRRPVVSKMLNNTINQRPRMLSQLTAQPCRLPTMCLASSVGFSLRTSPQEDTRMP